MQALASPEAATIIAMSPPMLHPITTGASCRLLMTVRTSVS